MDITKLNFSRNWENPEDFPTVETDEVKVRQDLQYLHSETQRYINETLIPIIKGAFENPPSGATGGHYVPSVRQLSETAIQIFFTPSKEGMEEVAPVTINLPTGLRGPEGTSAYESARRGGYTGSEVDFYKALAAAVSGNTGGGNTGGNTGGDTGDDNTGGSGGNDSGNEPVNPDAFGEVIRWTLEDETDNNLTGDYEAREGMTWADLVNSIFNVPGFTLDGAGFVTIGHGSFLFAEGNSTVHGSDLIVSDTTYYLSY